MNPFLARLKIAEFYFSTAMIARLLDRQIAKGVIEWLSTLSVDPRFTEIDHAAIEHFESNTFVKKANMLGDKVFYKAFDMPNLPGEGTLHSAALGLFGSRLMLSPGSITDQFLSFCKLYTQFNPKETFNPKVRLGSLLRLFVEVGLLPSHPPINPLRARMIIAEFYFSMGTINENLDRENIQGIINLIHTISQVQDQTQALAIFEADEHVQKSLYQCDRNAESPEAMLRIAATELFSVRLMMDAAAITDQFFAYADTYERVHPNSGRSPRHNANLFLGVLAQTGMLATETPKPATPPKDPTPPQEDAPRVFEPITRPRVAALDEILGQVFPVLSDGFVRVIDYMGDDTSIVQAARVSYGAGTKTSRADRALIDYLMRKHHTTPFEMCEIKFHIRMPMDSWRQMIRNRSASVNEYSTRYSIAIDACDTTKPDAWRLQSTANKQGSSGQTLPLDKGAYLSEREHSLHAVAREVYEERIALGVAREQARKDLPLSNYTEAYWKIDLHNLLNHFLNLRMSEHAQLEIRSYANIIGDIVSKWVPHTWAAFQDHRLHAMPLSGTEIQFIQLLMSGSQDEAWEFAVKNGLDTGTKRGEFEVKTMRLGMFNLLKPRP